MLFLTPRLVRRHLDHLYWLVRCCTPMAKWLHVSMVYETRIWIELIPDGVLYLVAFSLYSFALKFNLKYEVRAIVTYIYISSKRVRTRTEFYVFLHQDEVLHAAYLSLWELLNLPNRINGCSRYGVSFVLTCPTTSELSILCRRPRWLRCSTSVSRKVCHFTINSKQYPLKNRLT